MECGWMLKEKNKPFWQMKTAVKQLSK